MKVPNGKYEQRLGGAAPKARGDFAPITERRSAASGEGAVLLTGATGFVGIALLARYLERTDRRVYVLQRGKDERELANRVRHALAALFGEEDAHAERVVAVRGDITRPGLGLGRRRDAIAENVGRQVHPREPAHWR